MISTAINFLLSLAVSLNLAPASLQSTVINRGVQAAAIAEQNCPNPKYNKLKAISDVTKAESEEAKAEKFSSSELKSITKNEAADNKALQKEEAQLKSRTENSIESFEKVFKILFVNAVLLTQPASDSPTSPFLRSAGAYVNAIRSRQTVFSQALSVRKQKSAESYKSAQNALQSAINQRQTASRQALEAYDKAVCQILTTDAAKQAQKQLKQARKLSADTYRTILQSTEKTLKKSLKQAESEYRLKINEANSSFKVLTTKILKDYKKSTKP